MTPIGLALAALVAGGGYFVYEKFKKTSVPGQMPGQMPGIVSELTQGKTYAVVAVVHGVGPLSKTAAVLPAPIPDMLKATYAQFGFKVLSNPAPRSPEELTKATNGQASEWVFNAQWMLPGTYVQAQTPDWLANSLFILLPSS